MLNTSYPQEESGAKMDKNDIAQTYETILSEMEKDLAEFEFKRSGKGVLFYRYCADNRVGCAIQMQKSMFNLPGSYSFTMNLVCVSIPELRGYSKDKLTLSCLKSCLQIPQAMQRIGHLCRGYDHWYELSDEIIEEYGLQEYYAHFVRKDIQKCAEYLNQQACEKESAL